MAALQLPLLGPRLGVGTTWRIINKLCTRLWPSASAFVAIIQLDPRALIAQIRF